MNWEEAIRIKANEIVELCIMKHHDYGYGNINDFGEFGLLVRVNDKVARLKNLLKKETPKNESVKDTWTDLAGYAILALMVKDGTFNLKLKEEECTQEKLK